MRRNTDAAHVVESLYKASECADDGTLEVYESDARMIAITREEMRNRNLYGFSESLFTLEWSKNLFSGRLHLKIHFHEKHVEGTFELTPRGPSAITSPGTDVTELCPSFADALQSLEESFGVEEWDFCSVDAGSIGQGGRPCSFEFTYDAFEQ